MRLAAEVAGEGAPVVLLHGLTATRRYVVMGSRALERAGHRVVAYDARGHGRSEPAGERRAYGYEQLAGDLLAVLDRLELERALLAGVSMGAHTALALALRAPRRVAALVLITPGYDPARHGRPQPGQSGETGQSDGGDGGEGGAFAAWDALAHGLREGGVEGFLAASDTERLPERWRETVRRAIRQRLAAHAHPGAVADALEAVPRSRPFAEMAALERIAVPAVVVGSRDEADPSHPLELARAYARSIPGARLLVEGEGRPPIAWQGAQISRVIAAARRAGGD